MVLASVIVHGISIPVIKREYSKTTVHCLVLTQETIDGGKAIKRTRSLALTWSGNQENPDLSTKFTNRFSNSRTNSIRHAAGTSTPRSLAGDGPTDGPHALSRLSDEESAQRPASEETLANEIANKSSVPHAGPPANSVAPARVRDLRVTFPE